MRAKDVMSDATERPPPTPYLKMKVRRPLG